MKLLYFNSFVVFTTAYKFLTNVNLTKSQQHCRDIGSFHLVSLPLAGSLAIL